MVLANILTFAAEAEKSGTDLILPAVDELIWGAVAFLIVLFVLNKFAFPKLKETVEAREKQIQGDLESAERAKTEAVQAKANYDKQIADARGEGNRIIEEARQQAEDVRKDLIAKAEKEAEQIQARATEQLEAERNRTMTELQSTVGDLAIELAEKVVGRALDQSTHRELVDAYIKEVGTMSGNGRNN
ncbi:MAG: F-type H+-transporting ATPase subunit b [Actinomycetota bacterium]|jgi:F-type H+-transporting ATPase subunit b|nr:F-type H+-transporting ATPase subunit b [Actinomycetota bacterium]